MLTPAARRASRDTESARVPLRDIPLHDAEGTAIRFWCRVEQVAVDKAGGALPERLHQQGDVIGRDADLIYVRFDRGSQTPIPLRPHLVRVLDKFIQDGEVFSLIVTEPPTRDDREKAWQEGLRRDARFLTEGTRPSRSREDVLAPVARDRPGPGARAAQAVVKASDTVSRCSLHQASNAEADPNRWSNQVLAFW